MTTLKNHRITTLTLFAAAFLVFLGAGVLFGKEQFSAWRVAYFVGSVVGAGAIVAGVRGLRTGGLGVGPAQALVVVGVVLLAVGYWWLMFVSPVIALVVVYAGVIRHGLERELAVAAA